MTRRILAVDSARLDIAEWMACENRTAVRLDPAPRRAPGDPQMRERVEKLAGQMGKPVFDRVVEELRAQGIEPARRRDICRSMANHYWCTLFVVLARGLDAYDDAWGQIAASAKHELARGLRELLDGREPDVLDPVIDLLVDKSCEALRALAAAQVPLLAVDSPEFLRALRILAIFCCSAPERHPAVARECFDPLAGEATQMLRGESRARLESAFGLTGDAGA